MSRPGRRAAPRGARAGRPAGTTSGTATSRAAPIGTLTVKIHRQLASVVSTPPRMTPSAEPRPARPDQTPRARARSRPVNIVMTAARAAGDSSAAPHPCRARPASSAAGLGARPGKQRRAGEDDQPGQGEPPGAVAVRDPPAEQHEPAEQHRVGGHHPRQLGPGQAQRGADVRQRDVHHGDVEDQHQLGGGEQRERRPAPRPRRPGGRGPARVTGAEVIASPSLINSYSLCTSYSSRRYHVTRTMQYDLWRVAWRTHPAASRTLERKGPTDRRKAASPMAPGSRTNQAPPAPRPAAASRAGQTPSATSRPSSRRRPRAWRGTPTRAWRTSPRPPGSGG